MLDTLIEMKGEAITFHDPTEVLPDTAITGIFDERDVPEASGRGFYSTVRVRTADLPVSNPLRTSNHFQIVADGVTYKIIRAVADPHPIAHKLTLKKA